MRKLKWDCLQRQNEEYMKSVYDSPLGQFLVSFGAMLLLFIPIGYPLDTFTALPDAVWLSLCFMPFVVGMVGLRHLPKLHWLNGMGREQRIALEWYDTLTVSEKKQLPVGWESLVREAGNEKVDNDSYYTSYVAEVMEQDARNVIDLYRKKNVHPKIADHRIDVYRQLMQERARDLQNDLTDRAAIEAEIAKMS